MLGSLETCWFESILSSPAATLRRAAGCVASQKRKRYKGLNKEGVYCKKDRKDKAKSGTEELKAAQSAWRAAGFNHHPSIGQGVSFADF